MVNPHDFESPFLKICHLFLRFIGSVRLNFFLQFLNIGFFAWCPRLDHIMFISSGPGTGLGGLETIGYLVVAFGDQPGVLGIESWML
jgi:hypothetical protein